MSDTVIVVDDGAQLTDGQGPGVVKMETGTFLVVCEEGIFKGGKAYAKGDTAVLEINAGRRMASAGDVEEVK